MSQKVQIVNGFYRNFNAAGKVFTLVEQFNGKTVKVQNDGNFPGFPAVIKLKVNSVMDYQFVSGDAVQPIEPEIVASVRQAEETDEDAIARIRERFEVLQEMAEAAVTGKIRAMIVSGPPGVGKSYGIEQEVEKANLFDELASRPRRAEVVKGAITPIGLFTMLYKYSGEDNVLVFDDCDTVLLDDISLNLLKGALDTGKKRKISWLADSRILRDEGVPNSFDFKGSVVFITNLKFENVKSKKLQDHLEALESRCHFVDLKIDSNRDKILRIKQIIGDGMLKEYDFSNDEEVALYSFLESNQHRLREISLRTAIKLADLIKAFPAKWEQFASASLLRSA
jgi:hypothetical protein